MKSLFVIGLLLVSSMSHAGVDCSEKLKAVNAASEEVGRVGALIEVATSKGIADGDGLTEKLTEAIMNREKATVELDRCIQIQQAQK